jgi:hypothetical protein
MTGYPNANWDRALHSPHMRPVEPLPEGKREPTSQKITQHTKRLVTDLQVENKNL